MHSSKKALIDAVQAEFDRAKESLEPTLLAMQNVDEEQRNLQYGANVLRIAMEATLNKMVPYTGLTPRQFAISLASYAISCLPEEDHPRAVFDVVSRFAIEHERRIAAGIALRSRWGTTPDGDDIRENIPDANKPIVPKHDRG